MSRTTNITFEHVDPPAGEWAPKSIGRSEFPNLDPFLMLDEFSGKSPAGFPDHPHRGFETVTYILKGELLSEDFRGHKSRTGTGGVQWITTGRGIVHYEIAGETDTLGLQLWINLKRPEKMVEPSYQEFLAKDIPTAEKDGIHVTVIAGETFGVKSPAFSRTPTHYFAFRMSPGSKLTQPVPSEWNSFMYIMSGEAYFGPPGKETLCKANHTTVFNKDGSSIQAHNKGKEECHFMLISGQPIGEPIVQHGMFVMTSQEEIEQTIEDFTKGQNGFENAKTWKSVYANE